MFPIKGEEIDEERVERGWGASPNVRGDQKI